MSNLKNYLRKLQARQVSCFISGLHQSFHVDVVPCIGLALVYEAQNLSQRQNNSSVVKSEPRSDKGVSISKTTIPVERKKNQPPNCKSDGERAFSNNRNEKSIPRHCCKNLFVIEVCMGESTDSDILMEEDEVDNLGETPEISLHAINGARAPETMCVKDILGRKKSLYIS
ncbi:hypothetical protein OIU78_011576 [Salix suchowensis]|nr:hypothetical protein OIU78_011576 [Salix suchowensis]